MGLVDGLRMKGARERTWLIGDPTWMRRWLLERANAGQGNSLELKSRFGAKCLELAAAHTPSLMRKALPSSQRELDGGGGSIPHWFFEPRIPAGNGRQSGRWTADGDEGWSWMKLAGDLPDLGPPLVPKIRDGNGHHPVAEQAYKNRGMPEEATKVFRDAKTGRLLEPQNNYFDAMHRQYNIAVSELLDKYLEKHSIEPARMTGEQARGFVREVLRSADPRIRNLNLRIFRGEILGILKRRIGGRE
jgi:hypothetical protein